MNQNYLLHMVVLWMTLAHVGLSQVTGGPQVEVELKLKDDSGKVVAGVDSLISYIGVVPNTGKTFRLTSDATGTVRAKFSLNGHIKVKTSKEGYYSVVWPRVVTKGTWDGSDLLREQITLREVKKPIALNAKNVELSAPAFDQWIGFDFQKGDWVRPWGTGVVNDLDFYFTRRFDGFRMAQEKFRIPINSDVPEEELQLTYGKWSGELKLRVPVEKGGIYREKERYQAFAKQSPSVEYVREKHWEMRLPHLAPEQGYQEEPLIWNKSYPAASPPNEDPLVGYFLRTRVKLDTGGEIISANYAKIMTSDAKYHGSDIYFDPRGKVSFTYYFNPTSNDRNLEFNPEKNLFQGLTEKEKVLLP